MRPGVTSTSRRRASSELSRCRRTVPTERSKDGECARYSSTHHSRSSPSVPPPSIGGGASSPSRIRPSRRSSSWQSSLASAFVRASVALSRHRPVASL